MLKIIEIQTFHPYLKVNKNMLKYLKGLNNGKSQLLTCIICEKYQNDTQILFQNKEIRITR